MERVKTGCSCSPGAGCQLYAAHALTLGQLYVVAFLDHGTVESNVSLRDYRVSAGVGIRVTVPMLGPVPIAIDFGVPIVRAAGDRTQLVAFYIGMFK